MSESQSLPNLCRYRCPKNDDNRIEMSMSWLLDHDCFIVVVESTSKLRHLSCNGPRVTEVWKLGFNTPRITVKLTLEWMAVE